MERCYANIYELSTGAEKQHDVSLIVPTDRWAITFPRQPRNFPLRNENNRAVLSQFSFQILMWAILPWRIGVLVSTRGSTIDKRGFFRSRAW